MGDVFYWDEWSINLQNLELFKIDTRPKVIAG